MSTFARSTLLSIAAFLGTGSVVSAQGSNCTHDSLNVDGSAIAATFCVAGASATGATINATFSRGDVSFAHSLTVDVVSGASVTRAVDDVPLEKFGSQKRLHLTIAYRNGSASLERALLLPGAVILK